MRRIEVVEDYRCPDAHYVELYLRLGERQNVEPWLRHAKRFGPGARILELGCGAGGISIPLARQGFLVTGVDFHPGMIRAAGRLELPNLNLLEARIEDLRLNERFDLVIAAARLINRYDLFPGFQNRSKIYATAVHHLSDCGVLCLEVDYVPWFLYVRQLVEPRFRIRCEFVDRQRSIWRGSFLYMFDDATYHQHFTSQLLTVRQIRSELSRFGLASIARPFRTNPADLQLAYSRRAGSKERGAQ